MYYLGGVVQRGNGLLALRLVGCSSRSFGRLSVFRTCRHTSPCDYCCGICLRDCCVSIPPTYLLLRHISGVPVPRRPLAECVSVVCQRYRSCRAHVFESCRTGVARSDPPAAWGASRPVSACRYRCGTSTRACTRCRRTYSRPARMTTGG